MNPLSTIPIPTFPTTFSCLKKIERESYFLFGQKIKPISETNHERKPPNPPCPLMRPSHDLPGPERRPSQDQLHVLHNGPPSSEVSRWRPQPIGTNITSLWAVKAISNVGLSVAKGCLSSEWNDMRDIWLSCIRRTGPVPVEEV
jgi:hypothetical protein